MRSCIHMRSLGQNLRTSCSGGPSFKSYTISIYVCVYNLNIVHYIYIYMDNIRCPRAQIYDLCAIDGRPRCTLYIHTREYLLRDVQKSAVRARTLLCKRPFACNPRGLNSCRRRCCGLCRLINRIVYYTYVYIHHRVSGIESVKERKREKLYRG